MTTILLIRHAMNDYVGNTLVGRRPGVHLNEAGRAEAERLARRLAATPIEAVYSSPLERATETAEPLARRAALPVTVCHALSEIDFGDWTGRAIRDLEDDPAWKRCNSDRASARIPGGESMLEVQLRMIGAVEGFRDRHRGGVVAAVSHGDPIRAALTHYLGLPLDLLDRLEVQTASVSVVLLRDWGPLVLRINDRGELP
jgi:probable phosphoglycerate mutase